MMALRCQNDYALCSYKYDPDKGDPENHIPPGTLLKEVPAGWICPQCRAEEIELEDKGGNDGQI